MSQLLLPAQTPLLNPKIRSHKNRPIPQLNILDTVCLRWRLRLILTDALKALRIQLRPQPATLLAQDPGPRVVL